LFYLKGYAHPARYQALVAANKVPADLAAKLPPATEYANIKYPTLAQLDAAAAVVAQNWGPQVLGS
jgi:putative spermidine/putrescine transport system substrate-binding protein